MISGHISTRVLRFALPALVIVLVMAGLRGTVSAPGWTGRLHDDGVLVGLVLEVVLAGLLTALLWRARRAGPPTFVVARLRLLVRYLLLAGLVAVPLTVLFTRHLARLQGHGRQIKAKIGGKLRTPKPGPPGHFPLAAILYGALILLLVAGVVVCCVLVARRMRDADSGEPEPDFGDAAGELGAAVESGRSALRELDDARAAIIACYVAMESSLARAGAARGVAGTPDELLAKAAASGLVSGAAAGRLTALFYEARFSTHPLGAGERDTAERALSEIADTLSKPQPSTVGAPDGARG